ncbi:FeoB-associated Cys-rich membrane protein [uncultured Bacteroides sp.]|uniref:FeoB-associated Cys-rich membrane protein n=1 Tax=uncultured Bacteroides sp. TaxID=162156 RepID=UPI002AA68C04|nr:FeoB-associated Cys-rich membrane protein [uncultured Bacteroides sp.]
MVQNIITLMIVFAAIVYVALSVFRKPATKNQSKCAGCSGCALKDMVKDKSGDKLYGCH